LYFYSQQPYSWLALSYIRLTLLILIILNGFTPKELLAQATETPPGIRYVIHADMGLVGYGGVITFNFETRIWTNKKSLQLRARSGYGYFGVGLYDDVREIKGAPLNLTALFGRRKHFFEVTAGGILGVETLRSKYSVTKSIGFWPLIDIGYRFERSPKGIILRAKIGTGGIGGGIGFGF
jgi:hypothetical protein